MGAAYRQTTDDEHTKTAPGHHVDLHPYLRAHRDAPPRDSRRREATLREGQGKEPPRRALPYQERIRSRVPHAERRFRRRQRRAWTWRGLLRRQRGQRPGSRAPGAWVDGGRVRRKRDGVPRARGPLPHVRQQGRIGVVSGFLGGWGFAGRVGEGLERRVPARSTHTHTK